MTIINIKANIKAITDNIDGFMADLKDRGYSDRSVVEHKKIFGELLLFLKQDQSTTLKGNIADDFIEWKIDRRKQKKYSYHYRTQVKCYINRYLNWYLSSPLRSLGYDRISLEKEIPLFIKTTNYSNSRWPIELRNGLGSFFDYLDRYKFKKFSAHKTKRIDPSFISSFLEDKELHFYGSKYNVKTEARLRSAVTKYHNYLVKCGVPDLNIPNSTSVEEPLYFEAIINEYLDYLKQHCGRSESTIYSASLHLKRFDRFLQKEGISCIKKIKLFHIDAYVLSRCPKKILTF